ncbi:hypothetical protein JTT01_05135 [Clostridium botulinum]|nr:hypothetical protein [Clostridium botulinum]
MLSNRGGGYSKKMILLSIDGERIQLLTLKDYFLYKNINANNYWSATYEPCKSEGEHYKVKFYSDKIILQERMVI